MSAISDEIIELIKICSSLKAMGDEEASLVLGKKIIDSFYQDKDAVIFQLAYSHRELNYKDINALLNAAFLCAATKTVYTAFKNLTAGSKAEFWFKKGSNDPRLMRFFTFLSRTDKRIDLENDLTILCEARNAILNNATLNIPISLSKYTLDNFLKGISTGEIRITSEGLR